MLITQLSQGFLYMNRAMHQTYILNPEGILRKGHSTELLSIVRVTHLSAQRIRAQILTVLKSYFTAKEVPIRHNPFHFTKHREA